MPPKAPLVLHATAVAVGNRGLLIQGRSGSGKSGIALQLMALGASLVADDRVEISICGAQLWMTCPAAIAGKIEARGIGLLKAAHVAKAPLTVVLDLDRSDAARLPPIRKTTILGQSVPLLHKHASPYFASGLLQYLKSGPVEEA